MSGVLDPGRQFIALARFESAEAAQANSDRPEQGAWWAETCNLFDGEVTFHDGTSAALELIGDPDRAGFVQVIQGRTSDPDRARQLWAASRDTRLAHRPELLGRVVVRYDDDGFTTAVYFTTEDEARAGERKEMPPELQARMAELRQLTIGEPEFFDFQQPWLYSPR